MQWALLLGFILQSSGVYAVNWAIPATYNQLKSGKFCGQTPDSEVKSYVQESCRKGLSQPAQLSAGVAWDYVHKFVFEDAAIKQLAADECTAQALEVMKTNPRRRQNWAASATESWLVYQKVKLIRNQCLVLDDREAKGKSNDLPEFEKWNEICDNPNTKAALLNAEKLFSLALPILSDEKVYDAIDGQRELITSKATGKPITDEEILEMDMSSFKGKISFSPKMAGALGPLIDEALKDRGEAIQKLKAARDADHLQDLDRDVRNYLYEMGAVKEVMVERGLIKIDKQAGIEEATYGGSCIMSWYEPTIVGDLIDMVTLSAVGAGPASRAVKWAAPVLKKAEKIPLVGAQIAKLATPLTSFGSSKLVMGMFVGAAADSTKQIYKNCFGTMKDAKRLTDNAGKVEAHGAEINSLPLKQGEYTSYTLGFSEKEVPACKKDDRGRNFALNADYDTHCVKETLMSILPVQYSLMVMASPN